MSAQLLSRILLSTLCLGMWGGAAYFVVNDGVFYGLVLFALGAAALLWLWKPWQYLRRQP
jgi:membrane protein implicated in regulation of membrane protease activity